MGRISQFVTCLEYAKGVVKVSFSRGRREPVPEVETTIWACTDDDCNGWMRDSFSFAEEPTCPFCQSEMTKETRILPQLE